MVSITRFCRILGTMLANGVPILQVLAISRDATGSALLAVNIDEALENVRAGEPLTAPLKAGGLFPEQVIAMISVAEESNQLQKVLLQIADSVERRQTSRSNRGTANRAGNPLRRCRRYWLSCAWPAAAHLHHGQLAWLDPWAKRTFSRNIPAAFGV